MAFDFDTVIDRRGAHAMKIDALAARTGVRGDDGVAMWVADMDFAAPPPVRARLQAALDHGVFGYYGGEESWRAAVCAWMARRHGWRVAPDWITPSGGVCSAIALALQAVSAPGDGVMVFSPVYHAFATLVRATGRRLMEVPLTLAQGRHAMDLGAAADRIAAEGARVVLLCSPHNPGGRVWTAEELTALAQLCAERDLILMSDEIWHDLVFDGATHIPTAVAAPRIADRLITFAAASKTFNLAGLHLAQVVIEDEDLRARYRAAALASYAMSFNLPGALAAEAAYAEGAPWLDALRPYLAANAAHFAAGVAEAAPGARAMPMESTYLSWVDFRATGLGEAEVARRLREDARIGVNAGPSFGDGGQGWARFNIACPRATVDLALQRLRDAFADLR